MLAITLKGATIYFECSECQYYIGELANVKVLNEELVKHNNELREHNSDLKEHNSFMRKLAVKDAHANTVVNLPPKNSQW